MADERKARSKRPLQKKYLKRRIIAGAVLFAIVAAIIIIIAVSAGGKKKDPAEDPVIIGPARPVNLADIKPLYATYDYSSPVPEAAAVGNEWFSDALFIGDSRVEGLRLYSIITNADFAANSSASVTGILERSFKVGEADIVLGSLLATKPYGKVYIGIGVNEVSWMATADFRAGYEELVDAVKSAQPDAAVYLMNVIPVSSSKGWSSEIAAYNAAIQSIASDKKVYFLDSASVYADAAGALDSASNAGDGVNIDVGAYDKWLTYLKSHTVNRDMYKN